MKMVTATVLVCCQAGRYSDVLKALEKKRGVKKAIPVLGRWDLVVQVEAGSLEALGRVSLTLARIAGVRAIETLVEFPSQEG